MFVNILSYKIYEKDDYRYCMDVLGKIIELRNAKGWTEYKLSVESNIPQTTISSWFRKNVQPSVASLQAICQAFNVTMSQFFAEDDESYPLTDRQKELIDNFSILSEKQQNAVMELIMSMNEK